MEFVYARRINRVQPYCSPDGYRFLHEIGHGENLSQIVQRYFHPVGWEANKGIIDQVLRDNPEITNPNLIHPGNLLVLRSPMEYVVPTRLELEDAWQAKNTWNRETAGPTQTTELEAAKFATGAMAGKASGVQSILRRGRSAAVDVVGLYSEMKTSKITRGQYNYRRANILKANDENMGYLLRKLYQNNKTSAQHFRIQNRVARQATIAVAENGTLGGVRPLASKIDDLTQSMKLIKNGVHVLGVLSLGMSAYSVYEDWDTPERYRTLWVEGAGLFSGALLGVVIATTVSGGLVVALLVGVGAAAFSWGAGEIGGMIYDKWNKRYEVREVLTIQHMRAPQ